MPCVLENTDVTKRKRGAYTKRYDRKMTTNREGLTYVLLC